MHPPKRRKRPGQGAPESHSAAANKPRRGGAQAAQLVADLRFRRRVQHLERLGSRVTGELLAQLAAEHGCRAEIERFIDAAIDNEAALREFGFDSWPPLPLRTVRP